MNKSLFVILIMLSGCAYEKNYCSGFEDNYHNYEENALNLKQYKRNGVPQNSFIKKTKYCLNYYEKYNSLDIKLESIKFNDNKNSLYIFEIIGIDDLRIAYEVDENLNIIKSYKFSMN